MKHNYFEDTPDIEDEYSVCYRHDNPPYPFVFEVQGRPELVDGEYEFSDVHYVRAYGNSFADAQPKAIAYAKEMYGNHYAGGIERWTVIFPTTVQNNCYIENI